MRVYSIVVSEDFESAGTKLLRTQKPHSTPVITLATDQTSRLLATGSADGNIKVWDILGGFVTHTFRGPSVLTSALCFFEVPVDDIARHGDAKKKKRRNSTIEREVDDTQTGVAYRLAAGSQDGQIRVWDLHKRAVIANLESHSSDVQALDYSTKERCLLSASRDKTIIWWDSRSWKPRKLKATLETNEAAGFLDDGRLTYSAGAKGCVRIWETDTGREITQEQNAGSEEESIISLIYIREKSLLLSVQMNQIFTLYAAPYFEASATLPDIPPLQPIRTISGSHDDIIDLAYLLPDNSLLALATNSEDIRIVSASTAVEVSAVDDVQATQFGQDVGVLKGHEDIIITLDVDWSGHWIATGAKDNTARLWRVGSSKGDSECFAVFTGHAGSLGGIALPKGIPSESSPAYQHPLEHPPAFVVTGSQDQTVKRWDIPRTAQKVSTKSQRAAYTRKAHEKDINALDVSSTGQIFASASQDKTVKVWSVQEGEVQGILKGHKRGVWCVRFPPANLPAIQGEDGPVSAKGVVLTGSGDKTVKLWSLTDYTCLRTFEGHSNSVLKVAWLNPPAEADQGRRGVQFASAAADGLVKVWDASGEGEAACTLDNHTEKVWALACNRATNALVSGAADSTVTLWRDASAAAHQAATDAAQLVVEQEQALDNHVRAGAYREAIVLALRLNQPGKLLGLFTKVVAAPEHEEGSVTGLRAVDDVLAGLADEQLFLLLLRLRDWNANARTAPVAQRVLAAVVRAHPAARLAGLKPAGGRGLAGGKGGGTSLAEVLDALRAYTERHYRRMEELVDESYLVEYTLREMDALAPAMEMPALENGDVTMAG
jgi:U3 small nucleolar RNA-associated protein 13